MEKKDLLQKTNDIIRGATPIVSDPLLQVGFTQIQKHVLNYFREDLDYPSHSARAIVKLVYSMLRYLGTFGYEELTAIWPVYAGLRTLHNIWSINPKG